MCLPLVFRKIIYRGTKREVRIVKSRGIVVIGEEVASRMVIWEVSRQYDSDEKILFPPLALEAI